MTTVQSVDARDLLDEEPTIELVTVMSSKSADPKPCSPDEDEDDDCNPDYCSPESTGH